MIEKFVIGLFEAKGIAEDARNRLVAEGLQPAEMTLMMLREVAPMPSYMEGEVAALEVDPLLWGNVRETFAPHIRNGETVVFVRACSETEIDAIVDTMRQYAPLQMTVTPAEARANGE